jgi:hypothetical protein
MNICNKCVSQVGALANNKIRACGRIAMEVPDVREPVWVEESEARATLPLPPAPGWQSGGWFPASE